MLCGKVRQISAPAGIPCRRAGGGSLGALARLLRHVFEHQVVRFAIIEGRWQALGGLFVHDNPLLLVACS
jgi:hypothetical protein